MTTGASSSSFGDPLLSGRDASVGAIGAAAAVITIAAGATLFDFFTPRRRDPRRVGAPAERESVTHVDTPALWSVSSDEVPESAARARPGVIERMPGPDVLFVMVTRNLWDQHVATRDRSGKFHTNKRCSALTKAAHNVVRVELDAAVRYGFKWCLRCPPEILVEGNRVPTLDPPFAELS